MPHLYLDAVDSPEGAIDPAADIAAFLLKLNGAPASFTPSATYETPQVNDAALDSLVASMLAKMLTADQISELLKTGKFPIAVEKIKTDEIELVGGGAEFSAEEWKQRKLTYVGRKTITKYGCYGCHDIPNYELARPIGTALQDWGKKDRSRLAFEHIQEYLHHHGNADFGVEFESLDAVMAERLQVPSTDGVRVARLKPGHRPPGDKLQIDDVILAVDGWDVKNADQLDMQLGRAVVGSEMAVKLIRAGHEQTLKLIADGSLFERVEEGVGMAERGEFSSPEIKNREE